MRGTFATISGISTLSKAAGNNIENSRLGTYQADPHQNVHGQIDDVVEGGGCSASRNSTVPADLRRGRGERFRFNTQR